MIEKDNILHPLEIKKGSVPDKRLIRTFSVLANTQKQIGNDDVICMTDAPFPIDENNCYIPSNIL